MPATAYRWNCSRDKTLTQILASCVQPNAQYLPTSSRHTHFRSSGIPTSFPLQTNSLKVNGTTSRAGAASESEPVQRPVSGARHQHQQRGAQPGRDHRQRGAGRHRRRLSDPHLLDRHGRAGAYDLGTLEETSESILKRVANDKTSPDFNSAQLEGKYYFAATAADVGPAFQQLQSQIIRLSK